MADVIEAAFIVIGDDDQRCAIKRGVGCAIGSAGKAGAARGHGDAGHAGELGGNAGHDRGGSFATGQDEVHAVAGTGFNHVQIAIAAGHAEHASHAARRESFHDGFCDCWTCHVVSCSFLCVMTRVVGRCA